MLDQAILSHAATAPDRVALRFEGRHWTYAALAQAIDHETAALAASGVGPGDRVAILALNHARTLILLFACARLGAILTPLNWRLAAPELQWIVDDAAPTLLFTDGTAAAVHRPGMQVLPIDVGCSALWHCTTAGRAEPRMDLEKTDPEHPRTENVLLVYTSGTTGRPKGALLSTAALLANAAFSVDMHALTHNDHVLTVLPLFHVGGLNIQTLPALLQGATVTLHPRFDPATTLQAIANDRPTLTVLVPATIQALTHHPTWPGADLSSLRAVTTGSTVVQPAAIAPLAARNIPVLQVYGSTETAPIAIYTKLSSHHPVTSTGLQAPGTTAIAVDERGTEVPDGTPGEIHLRGPQLFSAYWNNRPATHQALRNGWFHTGDLGTRAPDGSWTIHDRRKNLIVSGGENIYPAEIERVLHELAPIAEAAVIGRPDPRWQSVPEAYVVLHPGHSCSEAEIIAHVHAQLARFKAPRRIHFVPALPRNAMGKVQHALLTPPTTHP